MNSELLEDRLDKILVDRGLVSSRERAKELILQNAVLVSGKAISKPGKMLAVDIDIELIEQEIPWVSRGALKLLSAIEQFSIAVSGKVCLDLGASTGGFTEVLLSYGAKLVYAVDVGHGQLVEKLRLDPRVVNLEKTHVKDLNETLISQEPEVVVIDVSFISLEKVLPFLSRITAMGCELIALIKPQFEVGKSLLNKKGVVKQPEVYEHVLKNVIQAAQNTGFETLDLMDSPILGGDGNKEFLIYLRCNKLNEENSKT